MVNSMGTATTLMTAEEYAWMEDRGVPTELVRGEVVELQFTTARHGQIFGNVVHELGKHCDQHDNGHLVCNAGIITERDPDTARGGDVWFVGYQKMPNGPLPDMYLDVPPDIVVDVKSGFERWSTVTKKAGEFLDVGVPVVVVLDPETTTARVHYADAPEVILNSDNELTFPEQLPGFCVRVGKLFE